MSWNTFYNIKYIVEIRVAVLFIILFEIMYTYDIARS